MGGEGEDTQAVARSASRRPHKEAGDLGLFERGSERRRLGKEETRQATRLPLSASEEP